MTDQDEGDSGQDSALLKLPDEPVGEDWDSIPPCNYRDLFKYTSWTLRAYYITGIIHTCGNGLCFMLFIYTVQQVFDEGTDEEEDDYDMYHEIRKIAFIMYFIGLVIVYTGFVSSYCFTRVSQAVGISVRKAYFHAVLHKDIAYFDKINAAEMPPRLGRDCELIEGGTGEKFMSFIEVAAFCVANITTGMLVSAQCFLVGFASVPLGVMGNGLYGFAVMIGALMKEKAYVKAGTITEESLGEIKTVSAFNAQDYMSQKYNTELEKPIGVMSTMSTLKGVGWGLSWGGWMVTGAVIFWGCAKWVSDERTNWIKRDEIEGPDVIVNYWFCAWLCIYIGQLAPGVQAFIESRNAGGRAFKFIDQQVEFVNGTQKVEISGEIALKDVHFAYPKRPDRPILNGMTFVCQKGEKTAIVGESGAGKSTIIQLMERFYEPNAGEILYDGIPVKDLDMGHLRRQIGYVSQEPILFNMTITENIQIGYPEGTQAEVEAAAKEANAYNFILTLQDGFNTDVGLKGSKLSGGQKQRIAIARAIIKKPKVLFLDEATSALDNESEAVVLKALNTIHEHSGLTMISVAQKLSTIRGCHKIIVLREGRVDEEGNHQELMTKQGIYSQMCAAQGGFIEEVHLESHAESAATSTPEAVSAEKTTTAEVSDMDIIKQFPVLRIMRSMMAYCPLLTLGIIAAMVAGCMFPAMGFFVSKLSEFITGPTGHWMEYEIRKYSIWLLGFSAITVVSFSITGWTFGVINSRLVRSLRQRSFLAMLHLDAQFFDQPEHNAGLLAYNLNSDAEKTNDSGGPLLSTVIMVLSAYVATIALGMCYQWKLTLLNAILLPFESICVLRSWLVRITGLTHPQHQKAAALSHDAIMNIKTLTAYQAQDQIEDKYQLYLNQAFEDTNKEGKMSGLFYGLGVAAVFCSLGTSLWYGAYLQKFEETTDVDSNIVGFAAFMTALGMATSSLFAPGLAEGARAAGRIFKIIDYQPIINSAATEGVMTPIHGKVQFENVNFKYFGRDNLVLKNIYFEVEPGQHFAITGASGSGKTTLTQLLLRFYDPLEGQIFIDGVDIRQYNIKHLRSSIALVSQEPVLFSGSVRSNVDFGMGKSDEEIKEALKHAAIPKFVDELGRDVGTRGGAVSGGQKQRIAIARAILRDPRILLLDEATSALDSKTERKILGALEEAGKGRTVIVIAHRLSTIEKSDQILVMDLGEIKERGTHAELSAKEGSVYQKLLRASKASDALHS